MWIFSVNLWGASMGSPQTRHACGYLCGPYSHGCWAVFSNVSSLAWPGEVFPVGETEAEQGSFWARTCICFCCLYQHLSPSPELSAEVPSPPGKPCWWPHEACTYPIPAGPFQTSCCPSCNSLTPNYVKKPQLPARHGQGALMDYPALSVPC